MAAIIQPSQGNGLTWDKDACWRVSDDKDLTWDREPRIRICARIRMPLEEDLADLSRNAIST
jgi:hypothetical protein